LKTINDLTNEDRLPNNLHSKQNLNFQLCFWYWTFKIYKIYWCDFGIEKAIPEYKTKTFPKTFSGSKILLKIFFGNWFYIPDSKISSGIVIMEC